MPWSDAARAGHVRCSARYASDLTDREWALLAPIMPEDRATGGPRPTDLREVVNAVLHVAAARCPWRCLATDFPPVSTVQRYVHRWRDEGFWTAVNGLLVMAARELEGREASPTSGVPDIRRHGRPERDNDRKRAAYRAVTLARKSKAGSGIS